MWIGASAAARRSAMVWRGGVGPLIGLRSGFARRVGRLCPRFSAPRRQGGLTVSSVRLGSRWLQSEVLLGSLAHARSAPSGQSVGWPDGQRTLELAARTAAGVTVRSCGGLGVSPSSALVAGELALDLAASGVSPCTIPLAPSMRVLGCRTTYPPRSACGWHEGECL